MRRLRVMLARLRGLTRSRQEDHELREEIQAHLEEAADDFVRQGFSPEEARRLARLRFGSLESVEEAVRDARGRRFQDLSKDFAHGLRMLRRDPAFAAIAIVSLALGIGANSAIFSIVNSVLLRPRPVANPEQLVELYVGDRNHPYDTTSYPSYLELRQRNGVFTDLASYKIWQFKLGDPNEVEHVWGEVVSGNYFDVLGVRAQKGRTFITEEDRAEGSDPVVVLSHSLWQRRFNSNPNLIGRTVTINNQKVTVIGIAPPQYRGMMGGMASELWIPMMTLRVIEPAKGPALVDRVKGHDSRWLALVGRLAPDVTFEEATARFAVLSRQMQTAYPVEWRSKQDDGTIRELFITALPERDTRVHPQMRLGAYASVALMVTIVNLVMLIACMNLASMLLARAVVRRREIAVRLALGASRWRIIRQLIAENVLLSLLAGVIGIVLGVWLLNLLLAFMPAFPEGIRLALELRLDWRVAMYAMAFSTLTGVLFGLAPALHGSRTDVSTVLKEDSQTGIYRTSRARSILIVGQVAFSLLLLISAGLVLRSLEKIKPLQLGFGTENFAVTTIHLDELRHDRAKSQEYYRALSERVSSLPGVRSVTLARAIPGGFLGRTRRSTEIEGYRPAPGESLEIDFAIVGAHYFTNLGVPIVRGRDFNDGDRDGAPCVAIINEAFRSRYFPGAGSPLGKHLLKTDGPTPGRHLCEIVGLVRDDRWQSLQKEMRPFFWMPVQQSHQTKMSLLVGTERDPAPLRTPIRNAIRQLDPNLPLSDVQTLADHFDGDAYPFRLLGFVLGACGVAALLLATIGIYGVVSYSVVQRTREVGIRMALGALPRVVVRMIIRHGMMLVLWGLCIGLVLSSVLTRVLTSSVFGTELLFGVSALDSLTFASLTILLAGVGLIACFIPALRATRIDPIEALRYE